MIRDFITWLSDAGDILTRQSAQQMLGLAAKKGHIWGARWALFWGARINMNTSASFFSEENALTEAILARQPAMVEFLLERGANPNYGRAKFTFPGKDTLRYGIFDTDHSPLLLALFSWQTDIAGLLVEKGAKIDELTEFCGLHTPLAEAARLGSWNAAVFLLRHGASPRKKLSGGQTPLHLAAEDKGDLDVARTLINAGALVDAPDNSGHTPLMAAARENNHGLVKLLLERGANPAMPDRNGHTALDAAETTSFRLIDELLSPPGKENMSPPRHGDIIRPRQLRPRGPSL